MRRATRAVRRERENAALLHLPRHLQCALDAAASRRAAHRLKTEVLEDVILDFAVTRERDERPVTLVTEDVGRREGTPVPRHEDRALAARIQPFAVHKAQAKTEN